MCVKQTRHKYFLSAETPQDTVQVWTQEDRREGYFS